MTSKLKTRESVNKYYDERIKVTNNVIDRAKKDIDRLESERKKRLDQAIAIEKKRSNIRQIHGNLKSLFGVKSKRRKK